MNKTMKTMVLIGAFLLIGSLFVHAEYFNVTEKGMIVISTDDDSKSIFNQLPNITTRYNFMINPFLITNNVGSTNASTYISWQEAQYLKGIGWNIDSHTKHHYNIEETNNTLEDIAREYLNSKNDLISYGFDSNYLAYPFGNWGDNTTEVVSRYYDMAFSTSNSYIKNDNRYVINEGVLLSPYTIPRFNIDYESMGEAVVNKLTININHTRDIGNYYFHDLDNGVAENTTLNNYLSNIYNNTNISVVTYNDLYGYLLEKSIYNHYINLDLLIGNGQIIPLNLKLFPSIIFNVYFQNYTLINNVWNGGFETGDLSNWTKGTMSGELQNVTISNSAYEGLYSLNLTNFNQTSELAYKNTFYVFDTTHEAQIVYCSFYVKSNSTYEGNILSVPQYSFTGTYLGDTGNIEVNLTANIWKKVEYTYFLVNNSNRMVITLKSKVGANNTLLFDNVFCTLNTTNPMVKYINNSNSTTTFIPKINGNVVNSISSLNGGYMYNLSVINSDGHGLVLVTINATINKDFKYYLQSNVELFNKSTEDGFQVREDVPYSYTNKNIIALTGVSNAVINETTSINITTNSNPTLRNIHLKDGTRLGNSKLNITIETGSRFYLSTE